MQTKNNTEKERGVGGWKAQHHRSVLTAGGPFDLRASAVKFGNSIDEE